ncbi:hypothetical protein KAR91_51215 [Candidatus Pacearchaeota archaeon]|nr:hypothetical protein [Candidatus Pacearchaeota archaeon]
MKLAGLQAAGNWTGAGGSAALTGSKACNLKRKGDNMKNWIVVYICGDTPYVDTVEAETIWMALQTCSINPDTIVSIQCVNTEAKP